MTKTKKPTKRENFSTLLNFAEVKANPTLVEFINHEIELLDKKNSSEKKPTAQQTANDSIKVAILDAMVEGERYTITDIIKSVPECADLTNQRVSALIRQLKDEGKIVRVEDKRKAYFLLA
jgi:predicted transcriptional regulator